MTIERYACAADLFEAARAAAQEMERMETQREILLSRRGYRSPSLVSGGGAADANRTAASDALIDFDAMMRRRIEADMELLDYASGVLYGKDGRGGVSSALGNVYADVLCWRYLMASTWDVTACANHMDAHTAKRYARRAMESVDSMGLLRRGYT